MAHSGTSDPAKDRTPKDPDSLASSSSAASPSGSHAVSRRSLRAAKAPVTAAQSRPAATKAAKASTSAKDAKPKDSKPAAKRKGGWILNVGVITVATGIIATMSLPAFAFNPSGAESSAFGPSAADSMKKAQAQSVAVGQGVTASAVSRDVATATSQQQLDSQKAVAAAEAARQRAAVSLANYASYSGPSVSDFLANPPYPSFSLAQVFSVAKQYIGTPYVYGGATPAGFDCSGYVMYVYAQFGISLPHSVSGEAARGTKISINDAQPGDLIVMPGHIGFYAGNGNIMDAPDSGRSISIRPIWTSDYYVVRLGI